jgi:hypothetical protein
MGNFLRNGHEVRDMAAIGAVVGALALGIGSPAAGSAIKGPVVNALQECLDYQRETPEAVGAILVASEVPANVLQACGLNQFLEPRDERVPPDALSMGASVNYGPAEIVLPNPDAVENQIAWNKDTKNPASWVFGGGLGLILGGLIGENIRQKRSSTNTQGADKKPKRIRV